VEKTDIKKDLLFKTKRYFRSAANPAKKPGVKIMSKKLGFLELRKIGLQHSDFCETKIR
jgi:hypothetical protein